MCKIAANKDQKKIADLAKMNEYIICFKRSLIWLKHCPDGFSRRLGCALEWEILVELDMKPSRLINYLSGKKSKL